MAADICARWHAALLEKGTNFVAAARGVRHLAERYGRGTETEEQRRRLDEAQGRLRILAKQLRLVGNRRVQIGARRVQHHAYSVCCLGSSGTGPASRRLSGLYADGQVERCAARILRFSA